MIASGIAVVVKSVESTVVLAEASDTAEADDADVTVVSGALVELSVSGLPSVDTVLETAVDADLVPALMSRADVVKSVAVVGLLITVAFTVVAVSVEVNDVNVAEATVVVALVELSVISVLSDGTVFEAEVDIMLGLVTVAVV